MGHASRRIQNNSFADGFNRGVEVHAVIQRSCCWSLHEVFDRCGQKGGRSNMMLWQ